MPIPQQLQSTVDAAVDDKSSSASDVDEFDDEDASLSNLHPIGRRLWDAKKLHPNGVSNWRDVVNCRAVLDYDCPCGHRCLQKLSVIDIYEHRQQVRSHSGGTKSGSVRRDTLRRKMEEHYDFSLGMMQNSFVIAGFGGVCERAYVVASAVSEATYVRARADVTKRRPLHAGRKRVQQKRMSGARAVLDSWVRAQRLTMEGDKTSGKKWYTEKTTENQLWKRYCRGCDIQQQPTVGSPRLLHDIWKEHVEIVEVKPTGHAICETCSEIHCERLSLEGLDDKVASERRAQLDADAELHADFHIRERQYYDDAVCKATYHPSRVTCITIDAPTAHQFDLPSQARAKRDTSKRLDGTCRWQSKVEGVIDAGVGMLAYIAHMALGGGPNLVATVLLLTLAHHVEAGRPLGARLHLQLDNTTAENKNNVIIGVAGLLVAWGWFHEVVIFYMPVGHTYNELDAAFGPLINTLLYTVIATIRELLEFIATTLAIKNVRVVRRLYHLWDFDAMLKECMHPLGGFARTQQSSGMHEFHIARDHENHVRMHARQSSQSSTWEPEGQGELLFKHIPPADVGPPMAAPSKTGSAWRRSEVQCNVRRWLPNIGLHTDRLATAMKEWESDFLTAVDDVSQLPDELKLVWKPLPTAVAESAPRSASVVASRRDQVENPPVNPLHGHDRRQATVQDELRTWQTSQRALALANGQCAPMFMSDYLFVRIETSVKLARVCGAPAGGAMSQNDVIDILEYEHTPQPGVTGFFGSFKPRRNPDHDPRNKGSLAYVRHKDFKRDGVLVVNVRTFGPAQAIQVTEASLRLLATVCPDVAALPQTIPDSHANDSNAATRQSVAPPVRNNGPMVRNGARIAVHWTEDPVGWFEGTVTSSRKDDDGAYVTRVMYDKTNEWDAHAQWHYLDPTREDGVEWRYVVAE